MFNESRWLDEGLSFLRFFPSRPVQAARHGGQAERQNNILIIQ
jgi:hypothetical protein